MREMRVREMRVREMRGREMREREMRGQTGLSPLFSPDVGTALLIKSK